MIESESGLMNNREAKEVRLKLMEEGMMIHEDLYELWETYLILEAKKSYVHYHSSEYMYYCIHTMYVL